MSYASSHTLQFSSPTIFSIHFLGRFNLFYIRFFSSVKHLRPFSPVQSSRVKSSVTTCTYMMMHCSPSLQPPRTDPNAPGRTPTLAAPGWPSIAPILSQSRHYANFRPLHAWPAVLATRSTLPVALRVASYHWTPPHARGVRNTAYSPAPLLHVPSASL